MAFVIDCLLYTLFYSILLTSTVSDM